MGRVYPDTNVLFPFSVMDLLPALSEDGVHEVIWTDSLLDEWEKVIVREQRREPAAAAGITSAIRDFFGDSKVERADYDGLIPDMPGPDPEDREHMAAAVARQPCTILTHNKRHFPAKPLRARGVHVGDPDSYLCEVIDEFREQVVSTVIRLAGEKRRPPMTPQDLLDALERAGVPRFASRARALIA